MLFTQTCGIFAIYILGVLPRDTMHTILVAQVYLVLLAAKSDFALNLGNWVVECCSLDVWE